ncbi:MAG: holin [Clostridia bacterium]|nr:holin [Clostridia bacterium]
MILNDKLYTILKWVCLTVVPALNILLATLCSLYGWSWGTIVIGTIDAVAAFIGAIIGIGSVKYQKALKDSENKEA